MKLEHADEIGALKIADRLSLGANLPAIFLSQKGRSREIDAINACQSYIPR